MAQVLRNLPATSHPNLLIGPEHYSDAGIYKVRDDLAIVVTTDFFPPLVDDPYAFGQIAAANSLSDCYAMGAQPLACLNIVGFPDKELPIEILSEILAGGADKVAEAKAVVAGGHSVRDAEIKYGLAVTGSVHPDEFFTNRGAKPGDRLILTKPIGSGVLTGAVKLGKLPVEELSEAITIMASLNEAAAKVARVVEANAVTDITGFGLTGHAWEMAEASGVTLEIEASAVPLIGPTFELASAGLVTRTWRSTLEMIGDAFQSQGVDETLVRVLADAQTSGGLLLSVPADRAVEAVEALKAADVSCAVDIGRVQKLAGPLVILRG